MAGQVPWLDEPEMQLWRQWLRAQTELPAALGRALHQDSELSLQDYETLVRLTEAPERRLRISVLAEQMHWERSRMSHHLRRMEARQLVVKKDCRDDGRGAWVELTQQGEQALKAAAPGHVEAVRRLFLDALSLEQKSVLAEALDEVLRRVDGEP